MKPEAIYEYALLDLDESPATCWFAEYATDPCAGRLEKAHILPKQLLRREDLGEHLWDEAVWVPGCRHHHFQFDAYRGLCVPLGAVPVETVAFADRHGLGWYLERRFTAEVAA